MRETTVARSYGSALFDLGERHGKHDVFARDVDTLGAVLRTPAIRTFLETPKIETRAKQRALRAALADRVDALFLNFLMIVIRKRRQRLLREVASEYRSLLDEKLGRLRVEVTLAHPPDDALQAQVSAELSRVLGRSVIPRVRVEPGILGGIIVRYRDRLLDGSVRRRLLSLRHRLLEVALPETERE